MPDAFESQFRSPGDPLISPMWGRMSSLEYVPPIYPDPRRGKTKGILPRLTAHVEVVEPLGSEILLVVKCCDSSFLAMVDAEVEVAIGQTIRLNFNMAKMHVFESAEPHRRLGI